MKIFITLSLISFCLISYSQVSQTSQSNLTDDARTQHLSAWIREAPKSFVNSSSSKHLSYQDYFKRSLQASGLQNLTPQEMDLALKTAYVYLYSLKQAMLKEAPQNSRYITTLFSSLDSEARQNGISTNTFLHALNELNRLDRSVTSIMDAMQILDLNSNKAILNNVDLRTLLNSPDDVRPDGQEELVEYVMSLHKDNNSLMAWLMAGGIEDVFVSPTNLSKVISRLSQENVTPQIRCDFSQTLEAIFSQHDDKTETGKLMTRSLIQNKGNFENFLKQQEKHKNMMCAEPTHKKLEELVSIARKSMIGYYQGAKSPAQQQVTQQVATLKPPAEINAPAIVGPCNLNKFLDYVKNKPKKIFQGFVMDGYKDPVDQCNYSLTSQNIGGNKISVRLEISRSSFIDSEKISSTIDTITDDIRAFWIKRTKK